MHLSSRLAVFLLSSQLICPNLHALPNHKRIIVPVVPQFFSLICLGTSQHPTALVQMGHDVQAIIIFGVHAAS